MALTSSSVGISILIHLPTASSCLDHTIQKSRPIITH